MFEIKKKNSPQIMPHIDTLKIKTYNCIQIDFYMKNKFTD